MELLEETQEKRVLLLDRVKKKERKEEEGRYRERRADRSAEEIEESEDVRRKQNRERGMEIHV